LKAPGRQRKQFGRRAKLARAITGWPDSVRSGMDALHSGNGRHNIMILSDVFGNATRVLLSSSAPQAPPANTSVILQCAAPDFLEYIPAPKSVAS